MRQFCFLVLIVTAVSCNKDTPKNFQKHLVGKWAGQGQFEDVTEETWEISLEIEEDAHYTASVTSGQQFSVFFFGMDFMDGDERKFLVTSVDAFGEGHGYANVMISDTQFYPAKIDYIKFSDKNDHLEFRATNDDNTMYMYYSLDRQ